MRCVIVGAGHAAAQLIGSLRQSGYDGGITLIGDEPYLPYQRPPLSKAFLASELGLDPMLLNGPEFYETNRVDLMLGCRAAAIDRDTRAVVLANNCRVDYDHLVLATGARLRRLAVPGADLEGIHYLRRIDDTRAIRRRFRPGARLTVVGAGYIGLEVAAIASKAGLSVTVVEMAERVMPRVVAPEISAFYEMLHRRQGVEFRLGTVVEGFKREGETLRVLTDRGGLDADLVVVGVGILPETSLAEDRKSVV